MVEDNNHHVCCKCVVVHEKRIQELEKRIHELETLCSYDRLTGLLRSDGFEEQVLERMEKMFCKKRSDDKHHAAELTTIVFIDVDRFKEVNDILGHVAADEVLQILANIIRDEDLVVRRSDAGDEFLMALFGIDEIGAGERLVEIRTKFEEEALLKFSSLDFTVSFSFGAVEVSGLADARLVEKAIYAADKKAQEHKKRRGMNR